MPLLDVSIRLDRRQARSFLTFLHCQYQQAMSECWYSDRYRHTPEGFRGRQVLQDHPHIAGLVRLCRELSRQLDH
ncbi:hypothetical protein DMX10_16990 [Pseudomonas sp. 57B-090624]|uniref:hypothetical protein n=1 Tax=Pseudomonas sp. 57B-090624 TaxID=2213080 RepID=UPI000DA8D140|nr:hypothetical protein [Pseudomonas sp. 57B-090624]PZE12264.1 hypothetical protein DMX10_16990 [Pseudomonas sp. 57B-090624]